MRGVYRPTLPLSGEFWLVCTSQFGPTHGKLQIPRPDRRNRPASPCSRPWRCPVWPGEAALAFPLGVVPWARLQPYSGPRKLVPLSIWAVAVQVGAHFA